jgi:hypothetical protein
VPSRLAPQEVRGDVWDFEHLATLKKGHERGDLLGVVGDRARGEASGLAINQEGLNLAAKGRDRRGKSQSPLVVLG